MTLKAKMPFKGQIAAQVKKCHANEMFGWLKVEDSKEEKQWLLLGDMVLCDIFLPFAALSKVIKPDPHACDEWLTGGWM